MLDILMWPWVERAKALPLMFKQPVKFNKEKLPHIVIKRVNHYFPLKTIEFF